MLLLAATTDKFSVITSAATACSVHVSYVDIVASSGAWKGAGNQNTAISTATTTDVLSAPASGDVRNAKTINIRNKDAATSNTITFQFNANGTLYELHKVTLAAGEALEYIEGVGFFVLGAANPVTVTSLAADQSNATTTATEVTGLSMALPTGNFTFRYDLIVQTSVTTTAVKFACNHDGTVTKFVYWYYGATGTATAADGIIDQTISSTTGGLFCVEADRAKSTTALTAFVSIDTINADTYFVLEGVMVVTVAGNLELWHGSETAASTSVMAGSSLRVTKTG